MVNRYRANSVSRFIFPLSLLAILAGMTAGLAQKHKTSHPKTVRLYVFNTGMLDIPDTSPYQLRKQDLATTRMSDPCFLIAHPKGNLIWDTGVIPDASFKSGGPPPTLRFAVSAKSLTAQLDEIGYAPADVNYLALSHYHWDHVGNANLFAGATWLVRKSERDLMFNNPPRARTEPANYSALKNSRTIILSRDEYDVFGDGTVVIKAAPGHTPGHQVLYVNLAKTGPIVLSGDLYHYPEERQFHLVPTTEFNVQQTAASRAAVEAFLKRTGAKLWIQHDFTFNSTLNTAPAYYQ